MCKMKHRAFLHGYVYGMINSNIYTHCGSISLPLDWFITRERDYAQSVVSDNVIPTIKLYFKNDNPSKVIELSCHYNSCAKSVIVEYVIRDDIKQYTVKELETLLGHKVEIVAEETK